MDRPADEIEALRAALDATRAQLAEERERNAWRPIETAPVRTWLLTISKNGAGFWTTPQTMRLTGLGPGGEWESPVHDARVITYHQPTHWMPLPAPPTAHTEGGDHAD